jgi:hypothetical protein
MWLFFAAFRTFRDLGIFDMLPNTHSEGGMRWTVSFLEIGVK